MRVRNKWFTLILWTIIFIITGSLIFKINHGRYRTQILQEINPNKPMVALTFDDGPNKKFTPRVLDVLYKNNAVATFFICGENIVGNERLIKEMINSGNEIENHTDTHKNLALLSRDKIIEEISLPEQRIEKILPDYKFKYIRPPFGEYSETVENVIDQPLILWDVDSDDYIETDVDKIVDNVLSKVKNGSIIVFHDDNKYTVSAIKIIIPELENRGYQFVTVSQLLELKK